MLHRPPSALCRRLMENEDPRNGLIPAWLPFVPHLDHPRYPFKRYPPPWNSLHWFTRRFPDLQASGRNSIQLEPSYSPVDKPMGQGPFGKHWAPLTRVAMTPAEMFANAKDILQPEPGVKLK